MPHPKADSWAKLERAHEHAHLLNQAIAQMEAPGAPQIVTFSQKFDAKRKSWVVWISDVTPIPEVCALLLGEAVYCLRCALDYCASELAALNLGKRAPGKVHFPILDNRKGWLGPDIQEVQLCGIHAGHVALIEEFQPFKMKTGYDPALGHPLLNLRMLSNRDKHSLLQPVLLAPDDSHFFFRAVSDCRLEKFTGVSIIKRPLEVGTEVLAIGLADIGDNPKVEVEPVVGLKVAVVDVRPNGPRVLGDIRNVLTEMGIYVTRILSRFEPILESAEAHKVWDKIAASERIPPQPGVLFWSQRVHRDPDPSSPEWVLIAEGKPPKVQPLPSPD